MPYQLYQACDTQEAASKEIAADKKSLGKYAGRFQYYASGGEFKDVTLPELPPVKGCALVPMNGMALKVLDGTETHLPSGIIYQIMVVDAITSDTVHVGLLMHRKVILRERLFAWDI